MKSVVNEKKKKYAIVITFLVLMICIIGGTYAYFALTASNNSVTGSVGGASLNLSVTKVYPTSEHNSKNMIPQLESTLDEAISLDHKCVDGNGNVICQVYSATVTNVGSTTSVLNEMISFTGIEDMPNLKWMRINDSNNLGAYSSFNASTDKALFEEERSFGANTSNTYYFVFWIDEIGEIQTDIGDFRAIIEFDSSTGGLTSTVRPAEGIKFPILATTLISSLYNDNSDINTVHIGADTSKPMVSLNESRGIMLDNNQEYRYYGTNPNNYVEYNGELWRILSSSKVFSSESDTNGEQRVRLIKDIKIGNYVWNDNSQSNEWVDTSLMCQLNTMYYNDSIGSCSSKSLPNLNVSLDAASKELVDDALWYLGFIENSNLHANDLYVMERDESLSNYYVVRWVGKIGLMYLSDYVYAADLSKCLKTGSNYGSDTTNCLDTDWLVSSENQWLISPYYADGDFVWCYEAGVVGSNGSTSSCVDESYGVRPVVVLKSSVKITGGNGTDGDPYQLSL